VTFRVGHRSRLSQGKVESVELTLLGLRADIVRHLAIDNLLKLLHYLQFTVVVFTCRPM